MRLKVSVVIQKVFVLLGVALMIFAAGAQAGTLDDAFNDMGMYGNITGPTAFQGQASNYYTGGSFYLRSPQRGYQLVNFSPPSMKSGCGGIDAYAGAFSHINLDGFVAMLKNIGSNALGLAFQLALTSLSPELASELKNLSQKINDINNLAKSSCQSAKALVGVFSEKYKTEKEQFTTDWRTAFNQDPDTEKARMNSADLGKSKEVVDAVKASGDKGAIDQIPFGNIMWKALKRLPHDSEPLNDEERMLYLSFVGSFIAYIDDTGKPTFADVEPTEIDFETLLLGKLGPTATAYASNLNNVPVRICAEYSATSRVVSEDGCMSADGTTAGMRTGVLSDLVDQDNSQPYFKRASDGLNNIINNIEIGAAQGTNELMLMGSTRLPLYKMAAVAHAMPGKGRYFADKYAMVVASDYTAKKMEDILDICSRAIGQYKNIAPGSFHGPIAKIEKRIDDLHKQVFEKTSKLSMDIDSTNALAEELLASERKLFTGMSPQLRANMAFSR